MSNQKYISIKSDFLEKTELQLDYQYDYGMKEVEGYLTTLSQIDGLIEESGLNRENKNTLKTVFQQNAIDATIVKTKQEEYQEFHRLMKLSTRLHGELMQNIDSQLTNRFNLLLNAIRANNGDNKYLTSIEAEREVTNTIIDEYGNPYEYTYTETYNISLDELLDIENTPIQAIQDYYIDKVNTYRFQVLESNLTPREKQEIFSQSIGDIASSYYTGDLGEFGILDSTEDKLRKEEYAKHAWWKQALSWVAVGLSIIAIPLTGGLSLGLTIAAASWMAFSAGYSAITGYDFYTGERLTDGERWIQGLVAIAAVIPVAGKLGVTTKWIKGLGDAGKVAAQAFFNLGDDVLDVIGGLIHYGETGDLWGSILQGGFGLLSLSGQGIFGAVRKLAGLRQAMDYLADADLKNMLKNLDGDELKAFINTLDDVELTRVLKNLDNVDVKNLFNKLDDIEINGLIKKLDDVELKGFIKTLDDDTMKKIVNSFDDADLKGVFKNLDDVDITKLRNHLLTGGDSDLLENIILGIKSGDTIDLDPDIVKQIKGSGKVVVDVDTRKFTDYALDPNNSNGKNKIFESYGYDKSNASELADLYQSQASSKYKVGDYAVGKADQYGQRITIDITIGRGTNTTIVKSGWMINPDKSIRLITPFAGFGE